MVEMTQATEPSNPDLVDSLRNEWLHEAPDLNTSPMEVVGRILRLASIWETETNHTLKVFGIKYTDFDIIATLRRSGMPYELAPKELCEAILLTSGAMTTALARIERKGLIERGTSSNDKRQKTARLTPKGVKLAYKASVARFDLAKLQVSMLKSNQADQLSDLLRLLLVDTPQQRS